MSDLLFGLFGVGTVISFLFTLISARNGDSDMELIGYFLLLAFLIPLLILEFKRLGKEVEEDKNKFNKFYETRYKQNGLFLCVKERNIFAKELFQVKRLYDTYTDDSVHDYQILSRRAFGSTQVKVVDLGGQEKTVLLNKWIVKLKQEYNYLLEDKISYYNYNVMILTDSIYEQAKSSKFAKYLAVYPSFKCFEKLQFSSKKEAEEFISWLSGNN